MGKNNIDEAVRTTVLYSIEENFITTLQFDKSVEHLAQVPCTVKLEPFSEARMRELRVQAEVNPYMSIFQTIRDQG